MPPLKQILTGTRFGRLVTVSQVYGRGHRLQAAQGKEPGEGVPVPEPVDGPIPRYGGKGITVYPEWREAQAFVDWALAHGYEPDLTIDRIDPDGNYESANCRWIVRRCQGRGCRGLAGGPTER